MWIGPVLILAGIALAELRRWSKDRMGAHARDTESDAAELSAQVLLLEQMLSRLKVVEEQAAKVPQLQVEVVTFKRENLAFRKYIKHLREILETNGITVPELMWPDMTIDGSEIDEVLLG